MLNLATPLKPRTPGSPLRVVALGRVSTPHQDVENIAASQMYAERHLRDLYQGDMQVTCLGEQASGMLAERESIDRARDMIAAGEVDLVVAEDVSRIYRNGRYLLAFIQDAVDQEVRVMCFADRVDTADENWESMVHLAMIHHGMHVPATRRRVRRTADQSFQNGGMVMKVKFGYRKLTEAEAASGEFGPAGLRIAKRTECTPVIREMRDRVVRGESYAGVTDWLTDQGVCPGEYARRWSGRVVRDLLLDPILSGRRRFRTTMSRLVYKTGKPRVERNPGKPEEKEYPELAHISAEEHAEVLAVMDERKKSSAAGQRTSIDSPLWGSTRSRSLFPGQHARCSICSGLMYRYGNYIRCANSLLANQHRCWNRVQVLYSAIVAAILPKVVQFIERHPGLRDRIAALAWDEFQRTLRRRSRKTGDLDARIAQLEKEKVRVIKAVRMDGDLKELVSMLRGIEDELSASRHEKERLSDQDQLAGEFRSANELAGRLDEVFSRLAVSSRDFADVLRRLIPMFAILPVQALDRPQVRARAKLTLSLKAWGGSEADDEQVDVDLFEPPVHVRHLDRVVQAKEQHPSASLRALATQLGLNYMTVKRSLAYARLMRESGLETPYRELVQQPELASRWTA